MKESNEWVRQPKVDMAADEVVAERGCHPGEVKPYWVAKKLGVEQNGALSEKVFDWRRRRIAENATLTIAVPPQAEAAFREHFDQLGRDAVDIFRRTVGTIGSELDRAATLRINDAERRRDQAEIDRDDVLVLCRQAEEQRAGLEAQVADLRKQLDEARRANDRLLGRLEQRDRDAKSQAIQHTVAPAPSDDRQGDIAEPLGNVPDGAVEDGKAPELAVSSADVDGPLTDLNGKGQPTSIEADDPLEGQVEMPPATSDNTDQADVAGRDQS